MEEKRIYYTELENWKTRRQDKKMEEYWKGQATDHELSGWEEYQKEWNFRETDYDWKPSSNRLMGYDGEYFYPQYGSPGFAFDTSLVKYLRRKSCLINEKGQCVDIRYED